MNLNFYFFLYIGVAIGLLSSLGFIDYLMTHFPNAIFFLFFAGLIIGGIIFLFTDLLKKRKKEIKSNSSPLINVFL